MPAAPDDDAATTASETATALPPNSGGKVMYSIGDAMTREQMEAFEQGERDAGRPVGKMPEPAAPAHKSADELLFTDAKVGARRAVLVSMLSPLLKQQQAEGKTCIKFKAVANSVKDARAMAKNVPSEGCNVYAIEMYKFCMLPPVEGVATMEENVSIMADVLRKHEANLQKCSTSYKARREELKADMKRQQELQERVRTGEMDASQVDSACKYPEPVYTEKTGDEDDDATKDESPMDDDGGAGSLALLSDPPACHERYVVFVCVDTLDIAGDIEDVRVGEHRVLLKVCAVFDDAADADAYAKNLKDDAKYKNYDVAVANMYEWLHIPPAVESITKVVYEDDRLTDIAGDLNRNRVNLNHRGLQAPADDVGAGPSTGTLLE